MTMKEHEFFPEQDATGYWDLSLQGAAVLSTVVYRDGRYFLRYYTDEDKFRTTSLRITWNRHLRIEHQGHLILGIANDQLFYAINFVMSPISVPKLMEEYFAGKDNGRT